MRLAAVAAALLAAAALAVAQQHHHQQQQSLASAPAPAPSPAPITTTHQPCLHLAWMGSGLLFPFYAGVADALAAAGALTPGTTTHGAMSGGAIVAALIGAGVPGSAILAAYKNATFFCRSAHVMTRPAYDLTTERGATAAAEELEACRLAPGSDWRWPAVTLRVMSKAALASPARNVSLGEVGPVLSKTVQVWAAELDPTNGTALDKDLPAVLATARARPLGPYASEEDLLDAVAASSHLPCLLDSNYYLASPAGGGGGESGGGGRRPMVDGGYAAAWPQLCTTPAGGNATADGTCLRIAATFLGPEGLIPPNKPDSEACDRAGAGGRPGAPLGGPGWHAPDGLPPNGGGLNESGYGPPYPPLPESAWRLDPKSCGKTLGGVFLSVALDVADAQLTAPAGPAPDINPGKRTPLPLAACEWRAYTKVPPNATVAQTIYDHGLAEGRAWAAEAWDKKQQ